jgi:hypothetical protein
VPQSGRPAGRLLLPGTRGPSGSSTDSLAEGWVVPTAVRMAEPTAGAPYPGYGLPTRPGCVDTSVRSTPRDIAVVGSDRELADATRAGCRLLQSTRPCRPGPVHGRAQLNGPPGRPSLRGTGARWLSTSATRCTGTCRGRLLGLRGQSATYSCLGVGVFTGVSSQRHHKRSPSGGRTGTSPT